MHCGCSQSEARTLRKGISAVGVFLRASAKLFLRYLHFGKRISDDFQEEL